MKKEKNQLSLNKNDLIKYWDNYYADNKSNKENSSFADYCLPLIKNNSRLLELGCGNARDTYFFAKNGIHVIAFDISKIVIEKNIENTPIDLKSKIKFVNKDFTLLTPDDSKSYVSTIYSRFTLHAILKNKIHKVFNFCHKVLLDGGLFLIETRSIKDPLFSSGKGERIDENTFQYENGHIRHFIEKKDLVKNLSEAGFIIEKVVESNNLSIVGDDNPVLLRVVARKK
tara:strand:+ start:2845 stop:3528 length:684 start_codon:yes stop_codon:yes gene_type:complete